MSHTNLGHTCISWAFKWLTHTYLVPGKLIESS